MTLPVSRKWAFRIVVGLLVVAFFVFRDELPEFNLEEIIEDLSEGLGSWTYLLVAPSWAWWRRGSSPCCWAARSLARATSRSP